MRLRVGVIISVGLLSACAEAPASAGALDQAESLWAPLAADAQVDGQSLAHWLVEWKRWTYSQTTCDSPGYDPDGSLCGLYQDPGSPVFFFDFSPDNSRRTKCRVPTGKFIAVPLTVASQEHLGTEPPLAESEVKQIVVDAFASMRDFEIEADGVSFERTADEYAVEPTSYTFDLPPAPNWFSCNGYDGVGSAIDEPGWLAGYLMLFPPPPPGRHELRYAGVVTFLEDEYYLGVTSNFEVE